MNTILLINHTQTHCYKEEAMAAAASSTSAQLTSPGWRTSSVNVQTNTITHIHIHKHDTDVQNMGQRH